MFTNHGATIRAVRRALKLQISRSPWTCQSCRAYAVWRPNELVGPARTRFAPSPTGFLHLGSLRTALFNYLIAKRTGGQFILRIEDTDQKRTVEGAEKALYDILRWAGLQWDEGPEVGGGYGPYRQSERAHIHQKHAMQLVESGHAYRCFCSIDRLRSLAQSRAHLGLTSEYDRTCASIPAHEAERRAASGESHVIRLKVPDTYPQFTDAVYGLIKTGQMTVRHGEPAFEDPVLIKADGLPTYHLANVVDDHLMKITHVVRGIEWLPSTPKHVFMYSAFNWKPPIFCHVGLLQDPSGQKLSKRSGDVHVSEYRDKGYHPEALLNFVALLGWHNQLRKDFLPLKELEKRFDLKGLTKGNTKVSFSKLEFLQKSYTQIYMAPDHSLRETTLSSILSKSRTQIEAKYPDTPEEFKSDEYICAVLNCNLKNYTTPAKLVEDQDYFFTLSPNFDSLEATNYRLKLSGEEVIKLKEALNQVHKTLARRLAKGETFDGGLLDRILNSSFPDKQARGMVHGALRYALAGGKSGPSVHDIVEILGEEETLRRLKEVDWSGRRAQVDEKGRVVMTWKEPERPKMTKGDTDEIADLIVKSRE